MNDSIRGAEKLNVAYLYCRASTDGKTVVEPFFKDEEGGYLKDGPGPVITSHTRLTKWDVPYVSLPRIKTQFREFFQYLIMNMSEGDKKDLAKMATELAPLLADPVMQDPQAAKANTAVDDPAEALRRRLRAVPTPDAAPEEMSIQAATAAPF